MSTPLSHFFKNSVRTLSDNKLFSILNIVGLAAGIATSFLLAQYIVFEYSFDRFHQYSEDIYRIPISYTGLEEVPGIYAQNHPTIGPTMKKDFPEVLDFCRFVHPNIFIGNVAIKYTDESGQIKSFREENIYFADSSVFTMFSFPLIKGDARTALAEPYSIAVSRSAAKKYFGNDEPIGKTLYFLGAMPLEVTAVFENIPENSHIKFDILISYQTIWRPSAFESWKYPQFYNYILLKPGTDPDNFELKLPSFIEKYLGDINREYGFQTHFSLQRITDIHLKSRCSLEPRVQGNANTVNFLSLLALFVLIIAWINYVNLTLTRAFTRAREVGLRKVIGARRSNLVIQFLVDSFIANALATLLGMIIVILVWPYFTQLAGNNMSENIWSNDIFRSLKFLWILLVILFAGSIIAGLYPALRLSAFQPAIVIKGNYLGSYRGVQLRKLLVLFQFTITLALIAGTLLVRHQLIYMRGKDLGFRKDNILVIKSPAIYDSTTFDRSRYFRSELMRLPEIISTTSSTEIPGHMIEGGNGFRKIDQQVEEEEVTRLIGVDSKFFMTFNIQLVAGRYFNEYDSSTYNTDNNRVVLNRNAAEVLGFTDPEQIIGEKIYFRLGPGLHKAEVIGVVENYHQRSPREALDPMLFYYPTWMNNKFLSIHINSKNLQETLSSIRNLYNEALYDNPLEYFFLDEYYNRQYRADNQFENMFGAFAVLAIIVACLGLYGLSFFIVNHRKMEIGIRKVHGSSIIQIITILYREFIMLILFSLLIASPIIYWLGNKWLSNFAFRVDLNWPIFVIPLMILLIMTITTSVVQTVRSAVENPVNVLRY